MGESEYLPDGCGKLPTCLAIGTLTVDVYERASALERNTRLGPGFGAAEVSAKGELADGLAHLSQFDICEACPLKYVMRWMAAEVS